MMRWVATGVLVTLAGCTPGAHQPEMTPAQQAVMAVDMQLAGTWRLSNYQPDQPLSLAMLLGLQKDRIVVTFQNGHMRSASSLLSFDRKYRLDVTIGETFKIFITDEGGVEYESWARFGQPNQIWFESKTEPWKGQGIRDRVVGPM